MLRNGLQGSFLDEQTGKIIFKQIVKTITYIHSLELVHRNLKISKMVINPET